ncbi:MAG: outer membrane lipoprotein-sorting protein [Myxococcota bacterium]
MTSLVARVWPAASVLGLALSVPLVAGAEMPTGREIMELVEARDDGDQMTQDMEMILIDKRGNRRERMIRMMSRDVGEDTQSIMFFLSPAPVKDTGFLTYDYDSPDEDDDQWLFLPALKKTKRIATGDKSGSFMGSDFTYSDMTDRDLDRYDYRLLQQDEVAGHRVWVVEAIPNSDDEIKETGYTKSVLFVRQDNHVVVRAKSWVKKGKRQKYMDVKSLELIDGIWVSTETHMTTKKAKSTLHKTVLKAHNVRFNQGHSEDLFTVRKLERGP